MLPFLCEKNTNILIIIEITIYAIVYNLIILMNIDLFYGYFKEKHQTELFYL